MFSITVNPFARVALRPPGLDTTTFQVPVAAAEGRANVQVIFVDDATMTFVAATSADPVLLTFDRCARGEPCAGDDDIRQGLAGEC